MSQRLPETLSKRASRQAIAALLNAVDSDIWRNRGEAQKLTSGAELNCRISVGDVDGSATNAVLAVASVETRPRRQSREYGYDRYNHDEFDDREAALSGSPNVMAAYIESHKGSAATIKQHMAAIRMMFSWLTEKGIPAINPAGKLKRPNFHILKAKRWRLAPRKFKKSSLPSIRVTSSPIGIKHFLLLWLIRLIGAVVNLKVEDYFQAGKRSLIRFKEKRRQGKRDSCSP
jgi:hypothetical protein